MLGARMNLFDGGVGGHGVEMELCKFVGLWIFVKIVNFGQKFEFLSKL